MKLVSSGILFLIFTQACFVRWSLANPIRFIFVQYVQQGSRWISAPFPIQWKTRGFIDPLEMVQFEIPERNVSSNTYTISAKLSNNHITREYASASLQISCESIGFPQYRKQFSFFARAGEYYYVMVTNTDNRRLSDSKFIPCLTVDPDLQPTLYIWNPNAKITHLNGSVGTTERNELVDNSTLGYMPAEGFNFTDGRFFNGNFTCVLRGASENFIATVTNSSAYIILPFSRNVEAFSDSSIKLECMPNLSEQPLPNIHVNSTQHTTAAVSGQSAKVSVNQNFLDSERSLAETNATCWTGNTDNPEILHQWHLLFVLPPVLQLDSYEGKAQCLTSNDARLQVLNCRNPIECLVMSRCLENVESCDGRQAFTDDPGFCRQNDTNEPTACIQQDILGFYGLIQCIVNVDLTAVAFPMQLEYFKSLDNRYHSDWRKAPINELLRIDPVACVLYTNTTQTFTCVGLSWIAATLYFELVLNNATMILLNNSTYAHFINVGYEHPRKIRDFNVIAVLTIVLPLQATAIRCLAPWLNSTDILRTESKFETRYLQPPRIPSESKTVNKQQTTKRETFFVGQNSRKLVCYADGDPPPNYEWYFEGNNATEMFPELKIRKGSNGESFLEFPAINESSKNFTGEWKCIARNKAGKVEIKYKVDVRVDHISQNTLAYVLSTGGILLTLLGAIIVIWRRYKNAKELLRSLTETEVDDFFKGKPELIQKDGKQAGGDYVDFLPYNNDYEVPLNDMEFDSSDKNMLGSGFFSYVVRGRIISREQPVAIKITKPTADVTLFKTLLSEVKIMLYIGEHQNVVSLVGVCTEGIRNRCIHIATHICDLGSLDHFLRKCRTTFVNLINENQEIDCSHLPVEKPDNYSATTLDLISFGYQIASGMEHLAYKSIIHADLAARNVLLTGNKICKVSDFGLSKKLYESNTYVKKSKTPLPWRWMSIEALTTLTFSTSSDVWAYGVTLFEIFSLGDIPFPNETWNNEFVSRLTTGMRMGRPEYTTQDVYSKVMTCWERNPKLRPEFSTLREYFQNLHENLQSKRPADMRQTYIANMDPCA